MRTFTTTFILTLLSVFIVLSCGSADEKKTKETKEKETVKEKAYDKKGFVFEMPSELKGSAEIEAYFEELYVNLDQFADILEEMVDEFEAAGVKIDDEPSIGQQLAIAQIVAPKAMAINEVTSNIAQLQMKAYGIMDTLTVERLKAFQAFDKKYQERFDELNKRFEKLSQ